MHSPTEYNYPYAYALCIYNCPFGHNEVVWNSRDGVAADFIICPFHRAEAVGVYQPKPAVMSPMWEPPPGMRVFVDITLDKAGALARAYVERYYHVGLRDTPPLSEYFITKSDAVKAMTRGQMVTDFGEPMPDIIVVGPEGFSRNPSPEVVHHG